MSRITTYYIVSTQPGATPGTRETYFLCQDDFLRSGYTCCGTKDDTLVYRRLGAARNRLAKIQKLSALRRADSSILASIPQPDGSSIEKIVS